MTKLLPRWIAAAALLLALAPSAFADDYPSKPVRLITPAAQGGTTDILARVFGARLSDALKQPVLVENRASNSGVLAVVSAGAVTDPVVSGSAEVTSEPSPGCVAPVRSEVVWQPTSPARQTAAMTTTRAFPTRIRALR